MDSAFLSNIELYYCTSASEAQITISGEECHHILKVMRHQPGDKLYATDGKGHIFESQIISAERDAVTAGIIKSHKYNNPFSNLVFCIPKLKSSDRFEFALEKLTELGITRFIVFDSSRSLSKSIKTERWNKLVLSAMKQSLRSYLPEITYASSVKAIVSKGRSVIFEQESEKSIARLKDELNSIPEDIYFVFGPEGGLSKEEISLVDESSRYHLSENRLRSETAIITAAALLLVD